MQQDAGLRSGLQSWSVFALVPSPGVRAMALGAEAFRVSVAPMVDVTTRHFRYLIRLMSKRTALYTPMYVARRLATRKRHVVDKMIRFHAAELPQLVAQLGGDDRRTMLSAARRCQEAGYSEINLNLGCPARSAQAGRHGAALMRPEAHDHVVALLREMVCELDVPVTVKLRIGVDDCDSYEFFRDFVLRLHEESGCQRFIVHSRKALLSGLPPSVKQLVLDDEAARTGGSSTDFVTTRQNRLQELVPLRYDFPRRLKHELPGCCQVELNGGVQTIADIRHHLGLPHSAAGDQNQPSRRIQRRSSRDSSAADDQPIVGMDGVMLGRIARDRPFLFSRIDSEVFGDPTDPLQSLRAGDNGGRGEWDGRLRLLEAYADYATEEQKSGREPSREMLLKPLNQIFDVESGYAWARKEFATLIRSGRRSHGGDDRKLGHHLGRSSLSQPRWFGDELLETVDQMLSMPRQQPHEQQQPKHQRRRKQSRPRRRKGSRPR
jgi:tRNA-dihydrouridine synthase A